MREGLKRYRRTMTRIVDGVESDDPRFKKGFTFVGTVDEVRIEQITGAGPFTITHNMSNLEEVVIPEGEWLLLLEDPAGNAVHSRLVSTLSNPSGGAIGKYGIVEYEGLFYVYIAKVPQEEAYIFQQMRHVKLD